MDRDAGDAPFALLANNVVSNVGVVTDERSCVSTNAIANIALTIVRNDAYAVS